MSTKPLSPPLSEAAAEEAMKESGISALSLGSSEFSDAQSVEEPDDDFEDEDEGTALPPAPSFKSVLLQFLKSFATTGMADLYTISSPAIMCNGISVLEYCAHYGDHPEILAAIPKGLEPVDRMLAVLQWYISGLYGSYASRSSSSGFERKPFNPILGEQFRAVWPDEGDGETNIVSEQVSHHPPTTAFHLWNSKAGIYVSAHSTQKTRFTGTSIRADQQGQIFIYLAPFNEEYMLTMPEVYVRGLLTGAPFVEIVGDVAIVSSSGFGAKLRFIPKPWFSGEYDRLEAVIFDTTTGQIHFDIWGKWSGTVHFGEHEDAPDSRPRRCHFYKRPASSASERDLSQSSLSSPSSLASSSSGSSKPVSSKSPSGETLGADLVLDHARQGPILFSSEFMPKVPFVVKPIREQSPIESRRVWHPVTKALRAADYEAANEAKNLIENQQRALRKERAELDEHWTPKLFEFTDFCFLPRVHQPDQGRELDEHLTEILTNLVAESPRIMTTNLDDIKSASTTNLTVGTAGNKRIPYRGRWIFSEFAKKFGQ